MNRYYILLLSILLIASCKHAGHDHGDEAQESGHHHGEGIELSPEKARMSGVVSKRITKAPFAGVIHTSGKVMAASCDETTIVATISGRITHTHHISEGMHVEQGTPLFTITSADMQVAEGDPVQRARIKMEKAERDFHRAEVLIQDRIISEKDFALAKADFEEARLTYEALRRNRSAGGSVMTASRSGFVKQSLVSDGDYVEAGQPLAVITQNKHLYLRAEVPERHFALLPTLSGAKFRTSYSNRLYDVTRMGGHIQSYGRTTEASTSYIPVIFEFNNTGDVVQGSYAEVYLVTSQRRDVLSLPLSAVTEEQGLYYVYVRDSKHADLYAKREVVLGENDGERVEIVSGIKEGEMVVTEGAMQVKLASTVNAIPAHTHNH